MEILVDYMDLEFRRALNTGMWIWVSFIHSRSEYLLYVKLNARC